MNNSYRNFHLSYATGRPSADDCVENSQRIIMNRQEATKIAEVGYVRIETKRSTTY